MAMLICMDVSITEAKNRLSELIRAVESGEPVVITRKGGPVARLMPALPQGCAIRFGSMRNRIRLNAGWNDPVNLNTFLAGEL